MAILTLDQALAGMRQADFILKNGTAPKAAGLLHSHLYAPGSPGPAATPNDGVNGAALTSLVGQIPFVNPAGGVNSYLAKLALSSGQPATILICDRLWHNSGLSPTSTSAQGITSPAWPARDKNGLTNGHDVGIGIEWSSAGGAGTPVVTLTYTNQDGTSNRTGTLTGVTTPTIGTFERFQLQAGDTGVRSVQSFIQNATRTSGTFHLVAYRVVQMLGLPTANVGAQLDILTGGFERLYDNSVLFFVQIPTNTTGTTFGGLLKVAQG